MRVARHGNATAVPDRCVHCGYDISGLPPEPEQIGQAGAKPSSTSLTVVKCPECGTVGAPGEWRRRSAFSRLLLYTFLIPCPAFVWSVGMCLAWAWETQEVQKFGHPTDRSESLGDTLVTLGAPTGLLVTTGILVLGAVSLRRSLPRPLRLRILLAAAIGVFASIWSVVGLPILCHWIGLC